MFDFRKIVHKLPLKKAVVINCEHYSVGYNNRLPGQGNVWEININTPPMSKTYTFEVVFEANRVDITETYNGTVNVTVNAGQTSTELTVNSPDPNNTQEQWTMVSWGITSYTPNDGAFNIDGNCLETNN